ncbi:MAG: hypothetical protein HY699_02170 [Deltaproteobacteria bacterium]|nr:hypothetical protein [Deltaproteobacteria bacterium]
MNSTDERALRKFFAKTLVPVAASLRARGVQLLLLAPEPELASWYADAERGAPDFSEIEAGDCERQLRALWQRQGLPELALLAAELMRLARDLEFDDEQAADVSPFIYTMY